MKRTFGALALAAMLVVGPVTGWAAEETAKLRVDMAGCASCAWIVSGVLQNVNGVSDVDVSFRDQLAMVTFDNQETDAATLVEAVTSYGFPAKVLPN